jgi:hypothetical protein
MPRRRRHLPDPRPRLRALQHPKLHRAPRRMLRHRGPRHRKSQELKLQDHKP